MGAARIRPCGLRHLTSECEFLTGTTWATAPNLRESEAKRSACQLASTTAIRDRWPASSTDSHSIHRILCPPGYLCRIARTQASDHLGHPTKFRKTGEEIAANCPQPRLSPL